MQGVKMVESGCDVKFVAEYFDVSTRAVYKWMAAFVNGGQNGLLAREGAGRPPKVSEEQMRRISAMVRDKTPDQFKFEFGLWTLRLIGQLLEHEMGLKLSLPTLSKLMHQLGFSAQRPLRRAYEQDAVLVQAWYSQELPRLRARAKQRGAVILFADEAGLRSDYHAGTTWAPVGQTPIVHSTGRRFSIQMLSAVGTDGQLQFMLHEGSVNAEVFLKFLRQLMLGATQPIILIVDGHSIHKAGIVKEYVESTQMQLELYHLPPYSPQLNPDEQVWKNVKERVSKQMPSDKIHLRTLIQDALTRLQGLADIVKGFFRHPECGFAN